METQTPELTRGRRVLIFGGHQYQVRGLHFGYVINEEHMVLGHLCIGVKSDDGDVFLARVSAVAAVAGPDE